MNETKDLAQFISETNFDSLDKSTIEELNFLTQKIEAKTDVWSDLIEKEELYKKSKNY